MKPLLFIACLLCCTLGYAQQDYKPPAPPPRKSMSLSPVEIAQGSHSLNISFNLSLGKVVVSIVSITGTSVYQGTVNATAGTQLPIDTTGWTNGTYIIRITDEDGEILGELVYHKE